MGNGNGNGGPLAYLLKMFFGNDPSQWVRFVLLGAGLAVLWFSARDFQKTTHAEARAWKIEAKALRQVLSEYVASNEKWQSLTLEEREKLIRKADVRFRRLYGHNGWEYQGLTE